MPSTERSGRWFVAALIAGAVIRLAVLPLPGTHDTVPWKIWSYNAATEGVGRLYGVGGSPPEHRVIAYLNAETTVNYPPLALYELGLAGRVYRWIMHGQFPNTAPLFVAIKAPAVVADAGFAALLFFVVRRRLGDGAARWATLAYWLNPAVVLDAAVLGYLDPQFALPVAGSLVAAVSGWFLTAGALAAAAVMTKPQAIVALPAIAVVVWQVPGRDRVVSVMKIGVAALVATAAIVAPVVAAGGLPNMRQALGRLAEHDMLSGNACNLWWIVGYLVRVQYTVQDYGLWGALVRETKILQISRFMEVGYPNPRPIGVALFAIAAIWALWTARRGRDVWLIAALGGFTTHAYATLSAQVHENHLYAAVPLLVLASAGRPAFRPVLIAVSAIFTLNLNLFYGFGEDVGYAFPRGITVIDATVVLAILNCAALVWFARVLKGESG
ncbi:MAG TPA: hypothetical protein VFZ98_09395 [Vicinamibacterales bacterium]